MLFNTMKIRTLSSLLCCALLLTLSCKTGDNASSSSAPSKSIKELATKEYLFEFGEKKAVPQQDRVEDGADSTNIAVVVEIEAPQDKSVLSNRIREWINEHLSAFCGEFYSEDNADMQKVTDFYGNHLVAELRSTIDGPPIYNGFREAQITVKKIYENNKCVTFAISNNSYTGGAHGSYTYYGATFRKEDGRLFGHDIFNRSFDSNEKLRALLQEGLIKYFEVEDVDELAEYTWDNVTAYRVELPQFGPWFTKEGLCFLYQQYEIAAYVAGTPEVTIPYDKLDGILIPAAAALLK